MASVYSASVASDARRLSLHQHGWALAALLAAAGIVAVWHEVAASVVAIWLRSETFTHGFVVVPIALWLAWRERERIARTPVRPWIPGLALVLAASLFAWLAALGDAVGATQFGLLFLVQAAIVTVVGLPLARVLAFPLAFLVFAIPFGEFLVPVMIDRTADFTVGALRFVGVPVFREANHFVLPTGSWSVVEACSGLRYLIASLMVGTLYAALTYRSVRRRVAFVAASIAVPVVANWLRAFGIVMLGHLSDNRIAVGVDHLIYGWLFFGVVLALLFWVGSFWAEPPLPAPPARATGTRAPRASPARLAGVALAAVAVAASGRVLLDATSSAAMAAPVGEPVPIVAGEGWQPAGAPSVRWKPAYSGFASEREQTFRDGAGVATVYVAWYPQQARGHELVTSANQVVRPLDWDWRLVGRSSVPVEWNGRPVRAELSEIAGPREPLVALRLYVVAGHATGSMLVAKFWQVWARLVERRNDGALVVLHAPVQGDVAATTALLQRFASAVAPALDRTLGEAVRR